MAVVSLLLGFLCYELRVSGWKLQRHLIAVHAIPLGLKINYTSALVDLLKV